MIGVGRPRASRLAGAAGLALAAASQALAHTSFMLPTFFTADEAERVVVTASFSAAFPAPQAAVQSDDFQILTPDGRRSGFRRRVTTHDRTILEAGLDGPGTYRLTTGVRLGRRLDRYLIDGVVSPPPANGGVPNGAAQVASQTETIADVYITVGEPTDTGVDRRLGRLSIEPVTHPNTVAAGGVLSLRVMFDGAPLGRQTLILSTPVGEPRGFETDANGRADLTVEQTGAHLVMVRIEAPAPEGSQTEYRSYTTSLTFNAR